MRKQFVGVALVMGVIVVLATGVARGSSAAVAPSNASPPTIAGTPRQGQTLVVTTGNWSGDAPIGFTYQWMRCGSAGATCGAIAAATGQTLVVEAGDVGGTLRVVITATNAAGSSSAWTAPTAVVTSPGAAPAATKQPDPHGTYQIGQTINVDTGAWTGTAPITFGFQWQRCTVAGTGCVGIPGATGQTFVLTSADLGLRLRAVVTGRNPVGSASIASNLTGVVTAPGSPRNTVGPTISNRTGLRAGNTATGGTGAWVGDQPIGYSYVWNKCDAAGKNCKAIPGETQPTHIILDSEVGSTLILAVRASNNRGTTPAYSAATAPIKASGLPAGAVRLASGAVSIPASSVSLPARLVISDVNFSPTVVRSQNTFSARFRVTDTRGYLVRNALVYTIGLPYSYVNAIPETPTGVDGYAVMNIRPTANLPLRSGGAIVFFVRARNNGDKLLAGVSTRRLVQVTVSR